MLEIPLADPTSATIITTTFTNITKTTTMIMIRCLRVPLQTPPRQRPHQGQLHDHHIEPWSVAILIVINLVIIFILLLLLDNIFLVLKIFLMMMMMMMMMMIVNRYELIWATMVAPVFL